MGIFSSDHAQKLLHNKFIVIIGDSVQRSAYKDLVVLLQENRFIKDKELRTKGETSFCNDRLVHRSELTNGTNYQEIREYKTDNYLIRFYFITRIFNKCVKTILDDFMDKEQPTPDVVFVNSCLWDISRYGRNSKKEYINNLEKFCTELDKCVPIETCIVWRTTLPVSQRARGGFLSKEIANCTNTLVVDVLLANHLAHTIITRHKYDVVDMHFLFTQQQQRREKDGVHWNMFAHRRMTNIFLTHIAEAWGLGVPVPPSYNDADVIFDPRG
uniref:Family with sequence similarity 113 n=1 Tax=Ciona savignyi TaxID=51511 RepID=H2YWH2_CIOSA